jgi:hypothetical protein
MNEEEYAAKVKAEAARAPRFTQKQQNEIATLWRGTTSAWRDEKLRGKK